MKKIKPVYIILPFILFYLKGALNFINPYISPGAFIEHMHEIPILILLFLFVGYSFFSIFIFFAKKSKESDWWKGLFVIIAIGVLIRVLYSLILPATNDEGSYLYDALLTSQGSSPFYFSFARSPSLIYPLAIFIEFFGNTLFVGRFFSILVTCATGLFIFLIGKHFKNNTFGFVATTVFMLFPPFIYDTVYIHTQPLTIFYLIASFFFLMHSEHNPKTLPLSLSLLALAVLVREAVIFYLPLWIIYSLIKYSFKRTFLAVFIFGLTYLLPWIYIGSFAGFQKIYFNLYALANMRGGSETFLQELSDKLQLFRINLLYYFGFLSFIILSVGGWIIGVSKKYKIFLVYLFSIFFLLLTKGIPKILVLSQMDEYYVYYLFVASFVTVLSVLYFQKVKQTEIRTGNIPIIFYGLFLIPTTFYLLFYSNFQTEYWIEFFVPAILLASFMFAKNLEKFLVYPLIIVYVLNLSAAYQVTITPQRGTYSMENLMNAVDHLQKNYPKREVFTGAVIIPFLSSNTLTMNITHPAIYCNCTPLPDKIIYGLFPTEEKIIEHLDKNKTKVLVLEKITRDVYLLHRPRLAEYITEHYKSDRVIGDENPLEFFVRN